MSSPVRKLLGITLPLLLACAAFFEFGVFRYFVAIDSTPLATYDPTHQILKYWPDQSGTRYPDRDRRHPVAYSINDDGWNSTHRTYPIAVTGRQRIAVVGDSFVEAFQVDPPRAVAAQLEAALEPRAEVFAFGISGAPLSQYLHMARYVARVFHPDAMVVVIVHNDFIESYRAKEERFSSSFMHVDLADPVREVPPAPYDRRPAAQWLLARSATARLGFFVWRSIFDRTVEQPAPGGTPARYQANINVAELDTEQPRIERAADYLFGQFAALEQASGTRLLFVMDSPREAFYTGADPRSLDVYRLNRIAALAAERHGLRFLDLTDTFAADYAQRHERFEFAADNHWNADAHALVARAIAGRMTAILPVASTR